MRTYRIVRLLSTICFLGLALSVPVHAQDDPGFTTAAQAYSSYHGGDIDHVDLFSGNLTLDIPLMSYPQKGGKLNLSFALHYVSGPATDSQYCDDSGDCWDNWTSFAHGWTIGPTGTPASSGSPASEQNMVPPYCAMYYDQANDPYPAYCFYETFIQTLDQAVHQMLPVSTGGINSSLWRAVDGSGWEETPNGTLDSQGTLYSGGGTLLIAADLGNLYAPPYYVLFPTHITDTNANTITGNLTSSNGMTYLTSWTDTMGRTIPAPVQDSNLAHCPTVSGQPAVSSAFTWNFPSLNGVPAPVEICIVNLGPEQPDPNLFPDMEIQSIVLPNGKAWTFDYDAYNPSTYQAGTGDLLQVNFPTGGSLSYVWGPGPIICGFWDCMGSIIASRTLNPQDGGASGTWQYQYSSTGSGIPHNLTTVTDPVGNQVAHTFTNLDTQGYQSYYETNTTVYKGTSTSGTPLKSVTTSYQYLTPFDYCWWLQGHSACPELSGYAVNVFPSSVTTKLMDTGQTSSVNYTYDNAVTFYEPVYGDGTGRYPEPYAGSNSWTGSFGKPLTVQQYNYDGTLLRTTATNYQFQSNPDFLNANLLNLPSSVYVQGSAPGYSSATFSYDENNGSPSGVHGNLTSIHTLVSDSTASTANCPVSVTNGYITSYKVYNTDGTLAKSVDPCGSGPTDTSHMTTFGYNPPPISSSACANTNPSASPTTVTNALGQTSYTCYDFDTGLPTLTQDPNGVQSITTYDYMSRTASAAKWFNNSPLGQTSYCYTDEPGSNCAIPAPANDTAVVITQSINSSQNQVSMVSFDGLGRQSQTMLQDPDGNDYAETQYDAMGRKYKVWNPTRCTAITTNCGESTWGFTTYNYDALSRPSSVVEQDNSTVSYSYSGNCATVTDEAAKARESCTDAMGRLTSVIEDPGASPHLNYTTTYAYDAQSNLTSVTQGGSRQRTFTYDSLSRLTCASNPEVQLVSCPSSSGVTSYTYDADGNVVTKTEPAQNQTGSSTVTMSYCYDLLNRMTSKAYSSQSCPMSSSNWVAAYVYDGNAPPQGCTTGVSNYGLAIGEQTAMCDAAGSEAWTYSVTPNIGWKSVDVRTTNGATKSATVQSNFAGLPYQMTYPSGRSLTYAYSATGAPTSAVDSTTSVTYAGGVHYDPSGAPCWAQFGGGINAAITRSDRLQPLEIQSTTNSIAYPGSCTGIGQTGNLIDLSYSFNLGSGDNNNVATITNNIDSTRSQAFSYDNVNRLTSAATTSNYATSQTHCWGENYAYDQWANFLSLSQMTGNYAGCSGESGFNFGSAGITTQNQISCSGFGYCYDAAGNLISISGSGGGTFTYNAENQLTAVSMNAGGSAGYVYDGDGSRIEKTSGGVATKLYWGSLDETDGTGNTSNSNFSEYVLFGGQRIARLDASGNAYYYTVDHLGSTRVLTEVPSGSTTATLCYDADFYPYGGERKYTDTCDQNYKFTGQENDTESNLDNFLARYDSSQTGRFMSPDPLDGSLGDPQTLNKYAYVRDNPLNLTDPTGMQQSGDNEPASSCDRTGTGFEECIGAYFNCAYIESCNPKDPRTWPEPHASGSCELQGLAIDCAHLFDALGLDEFDVIRAQNTPTSVTTQTDQSRGCQLFGDCNKQLQVTYNYTNDADPSIALVGREYTPTPDRDYAILWTMDWYIKSCSNTTCSDAPDSAQNGVITLEESLNGGKWHSTGDPQRGVAHDQISLEPKSVNQRWFVDGKQVQVVVGQRPDGTLIKASEIHMQINNRGDRPVYSAVQ